MTIYKYVVDKDWDSQQVGDIVSYAGAVKNYTFGTDGFASIYATILDANDIKVPGAVGADTTTPSPVPYTESRQTIFVVKGDFSERVSAAANAKYTLDFQSIYGAPDPTDSEAEDLRTKFVGSIVSEAANDVGIRVSSGEVFFGEDDNRTTITLNRTVAGSVGQWADSEFVVGGALAGQDAVEATAIVNNTDLTVAHWIWVGSQNDVHQSADDAVVNYLIINNSAVKSTTLQVRNTGSLVVVDSTVDTTAMVLRHNASFLDSTITVGATGNFNVYGENGVTATLTLAGTDTEDGGSVLTAGQTLLIGKADGGNDEGRKGEVKLIKSSIGYATVVEDETVIVRSGDITVNQNGTLTMDAASKIYAGTITNGGKINITIDADGEDWINATAFNNTAETGTINIDGSFDGGVKRVIYATEGAVKVEDIVVTATSTTGEDVTAATRAGKVALAAGVDYTTIYLSNAIDEDDDFAKEVTDTQDVSYYVDFNAFQLPESALEEGVKPVTTTILIDGTDRDNLDYVGTTTASIDGLTFAKDGENGVAGSPAVEDDPEQEGDQSVPAVPAQPELNVKFVLSGMDPTDPESYRELKKGITVEEGVTFTADKLYQSGKGAVTTINGELKMGTYDTGLDDNLDTTDVDESVAPDTFQVAGGKVNVNSTGSLTGAGIVSVIATLRDDAGKPIKAEMNVTGAPINLSKLEIGANSTVTLKDIEANEDGTSKAVFGNVVMRKTNVSDFTGPVLTIINSQVDVTKSFDTTKGLVNINFQSQLFVNTPTATIEGGILNLTVSPDDVTLLSNYGKTDPDTGELVVPQPKMFYTIVHAAISDEVVLTCDGDLDGDGYIDGTDYIYTDLGGQGLYVMHEDVAKSLYVNVAWENASTGDIVGEGMFYNINAFSTFTDALNVAKDNNNYDTSITVLSDVTETYNDDLFYKHAAPTEEDPNAKAPTYFNSNITVKAGVFDVESGTVSYPTVNPASWTVQYVNTAAGRMDLCISPAGAVEDDPLTDEDESKPAKTFVVENGVNIFMGGEVEDPELPDPIVSGPAGIWLDFWGQGAGVTVNSDVTADMVGAKGTATITEDATITAGDFVIRAGEKGENKTVTITGDPTATTAQITANCLDFSSGILNVTDSIVNSKLFLFTDDNVIGKQVQSGDDPVVVTSGSFELNSDNTTWNITGDSRGVYNYFYKDHPADAEGEPTFTATLNFTNGSVLNADAINNVLAGAAVNPGEGWTYEGHATPMTINFEGSDLIVGTTVSNAGVITFDSETKTQQVPVAGTDPVEYTPQEDVVRSTAIIGSTVWNRQGGSIEITESDVTAKSINNMGDITVNEDGVLKNTSIGQNAFYNGSKGVLTVTGGTVASSAANGLVNKNKLVLEDATFSLGTTAISNNSNSSKIYINGDVKFVDGEGESVFGRISNSANAGQYKGTVIFGVSNTGTGAAEVKTNIQGGKVAFSADGLSFDWAVTGVTQATATAGEAIATAKLKGGTLFVDKAGITLFDTGFKVVDTAADPSAEPPQEEVSHYVYNNTNAIEIGATGELTLDKGTGDYLNPKMWSITGLKTTAGGSLTMHWTSVLTVSSLDNVGAETITIDVSGFNGIIEGDKLLIDQDNTQLDMDFYEGIMTNPKGWFKIGTGTNAGDLFLNAAAFAKVSQSHTADIDNGWYNHVNNQGTGSAAADLGAADSESPVVLVLDGVFNEGAYLNSKETYVVGGTPDPEHEGQDLELSFSKIFAGGYDVSTLKRSYGPAQLNLKVVDGNLGAENPTYDNDGNALTLDTDVTISAGTFSNFVIGGDVVRLAAGEDKVNFFRLGDTNLTINGGVFNASGSTGNGEKQIVGGLYFYKAGGGFATITGDVNLTISGGTFEGYTIYGGNFANTKTLGKNTRIDGNVNLTLDSSEQALVFAKNAAGKLGGSIYGGSFGAGTITGDVTVTLTGDEDIAFEKLFGGSTGDIRKSTGELESNVEGNRILSFTGFKGDILGLAQDKAAVIEGFDTVEISGVNELNFDVTGSNFNLDVTSWKFAADAEVSGTFAFDFTGDTVDMTALAGGFQLGNVTMTDADLANVSVGAGISKVYDAENKILSLIA